MTPQLQSCLATFQRWLHLPDAGHVVAVLAAVAANRVPGDPVWLLVVGGPSSGKTEATMSCDGLPEIRVSGVITEGGLLSATPKRQRANGSKGGLLREIGDFGILVLKDFTSILAMNRDTRAALLAALREIYDGNWTRNVGTDGGLTLHWQGKVGLIAGCTGAFDTHYSVISSLGDRFLLYRLPEGEDDQMASRSMTHLDKELTMRKEMATAYTKVFDSIGEAGAPSDRDKERITVLATLAVRARSAVERDPYTREITLVHPREAPGRLALGLLRLLQGCRAIGADHDMAWRVVSKVALDCVPPVRMAVLRALATEMMTTSKLALILDYPVTTTRRAAEDLTAHGVLVRVKKSEEDNSANIWSLSKWARQRWESIPELSVDRGRGEIKEEAEQVPLHIQTDNSGKQPADGICSHSLTSTVAGVSTCLKCGEEVVR